MENSQVLRLGKVKVKPIVIALNAHFVIYYFIYHARSRLRQRFGAATKNSRGVREFEV